MSYLSLRPLGFGEILDGSFTLYRNNFPTFFTTALLASIPIALLTRSVEYASLAMETGAGFEGESLATALLAIPLSGLIWLLLWSALTQQTAARYEGRETSVREGYAASLRLLPRILAEGFIILLFAIAATFAVSIAFAVAMLPLTLLSGNAIAAGVYAGLTTLLAILTIFALMSSLFAVIPATIVEQLGAWASIRRSHQLARGARARIVGIILVSSLIVLLPTFGLAIAAGMGAALWDVTAAATLSPVQLWAQQVITILSSALTTPFIVGCMTLLYFDRRVRSEGYDLELAAEALPEPALG